MDKKRLRWQLDKIQDDLAYLFSELAFDRGGEAKSVLRDLLQELPAMESVLGTPLQAQLQKIITDALADMTGNRGRAMNTLSNLRQGLRNAICRLDGDPDWYAWGTALPLPQAESAAGA